MWPRIPVTILVSAHGTGTARAMVQPGCTACLRGGGARFILGTDKTDARLKISTTTQ